MLTTTLFLTAGMLSVSLAIIWFGRAVCRAVIDLHADLSGEFRKMQWEAQSAAWDRNGCEGEILKLRALVVHAADKMEEVDKAEQARQLRNAVAAAKSWRDR